MKALLLLIFSVIFLGQLSGQDSSLLKKIDSLIRVGYDKPDTVLNYLTAKDFLSTNSGTEIYLYKYKGNIQRIICFSHTDDGNVAFEFYPYHDTILFVYETREYFEEKAPAWTIKNFKGISSFEVRLYFWNNHLIHWKGIGYPPTFIANRHALSILEKYKKIMRWYKLKTGER